MTYFYNFFLSKTNNDMTLVLEIWRKESDGSIVFHGGQGVKNIADGFRIIENMKESGAIVKRW